METHNKSSYVLVTPAKNEEKYITGVLESVINQSIPPQKWIIVSDCSTDNTDDIVIDYASRYPYIKHVRITESAQRSFGAKAKVFSHGLERLKGLDYSFIGNLDADVTFAPNYYERQLQFMNSERELGVCSGVCWDKCSEGFKLVTITRNHAVGAVHFFRKECFEAVGGYFPVSVGGMDSIALFTARMKGWKTQCVGDLPVYHHKPVDSANARSAIQIAYRAGQTEYHIGSHPLFAFSKAIRRWRSSPLFLSSIVRILAYLNLWILRVSRDASEELVHYVRKEQMFRLKSFITKNRYDP